MDQWAPAYLREWPHSCDSGYIHRGDKMGPLGRYPAVPEQPNFPGLQNVVPDLAANGLCWGSQPSSEGSVLSGQPREEQEVKARKSPWWQHPGRPAPPLPPDLRLCGLNEEPGAGHESRPRDGSGRREGLQQAPLRCS